MPPGQAIRATMSVVARRTSVPIAVLFSLVVFAVTGAVLVSFGDIGSASAVSPASSPARLAAQLDATQHEIDDHASGRRALAQAGLLQELAVGVLSRDSPTSRRRTLAALTPAARMMMHSALAASAALDGLASPPRPIPKGWRIVEPASAAQLLADDRAAQRASGVPWQILAAIMLIETRMGRLRGPSSAGARGPMQFEPSTWAIYGRGSIDDPRDAIMAAGRLLAASGAEHDLAGALYHYNPSRDYVHAVEIYADEMRRDPRAFSGFYNWQVIYQRRSGLVLLPVGYPAAAPQPLG